MFFSHSQIKNASPMDELSEYLGRDTGDYESFFEIKNENSYAFPRDPTSQDSLFEVRFMASDFGSVHMLQHQSVLEYMGDMGGLLKFIMVTGSVITALVAGTQLKAALIQAVYHI